MTRAAAQEVIQQAWEQAQQLNPALKHFSAAAANLIQTCPYHGHFPRWLQTIAALPPLSVNQVLLNQGVVCASAAAGRETTHTLQALLRGLMPWRKGPFALGQVLIDSEWRSDLKFQRLLDAGVDFRAKQVLDVGCGNGYFLFRILGEKAAYALGLDPSWLYFAQFLALQNYLRQDKCVYLPFTLEEISPAAVDITLSMGVLYHRRDPLQHLRQLRQTLRPGGMLILETLVVEGDAQTVFMPRGRYAGMGNVWFLPAVAALQLWLERLGFRVEYVSAPVATTAAEQRRTPWLDSQSLPDFMRADFSATLEGHAPPKRVIILARTRRREAAV